MRKTLATCWVTGVVALLSAGLAGCPDTAYLSAASSFATAANNESTAFTADVSTATLLCKRRATFDFVYNRLVGAPDANQWSSWYTGHKIPLTGGTTETWQAHCTTITNSEALALRGMQSLSNYAQALQTVATGGAYDGGTLATSATDIGTLISSLSSSTSPVAATVKGLGQPLALLGSLISQAYATANLKKSVTDSNTAVTQILTALTNFDAAVANELRDAQDQLKEAMDAANTKLGAQPSPDAVLVLSKTADEYRSELSQIGDMLTAHQKVLADLQKAQTSLYSGATAAATSADVLKAVQQDINDAVTVFSGVKAAFGGKDGGS